MSFQKNIYAEKESAPQERQLIHKDRPSVQECIKLVDDLKYFLITAPANWQDNQIIRRYYLNSDEGFVSCVLWNGIYYLTGTDIVRCAIYRFECFGREIIDRKKFEEGIFSDLRALKCGVDAVLEDPKSKFLTFLYKNQCLRTQKKQKVFYWFSIMHDKIFSDALERDIKRELSNQPSTTRSVAEPALSFVYKPKVDIDEQLTDFIRRQKEIYQVPFDETEKTPTSTIPMAHSPVIEESIPENNFIIKEENDKTVITPGSFDDHFPLDYFPPTTGPVLIDPSVFFNPPESFDDQLLIDQTYTKTPYQDKFDFRRSRNNEPALVMHHQHLKEEYSDDDIPLSQVPTVYPPPYGTIAPRFTVNGIPYAVQQARYAPPPHFAYSPQMNNGQFYDSQSLGEEESGIPIEYIPMAASPAYYGYTAYGGSPQPPHLYEGYYPPYYASYVEDNAPGYYEEDIEENYGINASVEKQLYYQQLYQQQQQTSRSPIGRYFPSFEATKPPSSKGLRFPKNVTGRVSKPSSLRKTNNIAKLPKGLERTKEKVTVKFKDSKDYDNNETSDEDGTIDNNNDDNNGESKEPTLPTRDSTGGAAKETSS